VEPKFYLCRNESTVLVGRLRGHITPLCNDMYAYDAVSFEPLRGRPNKMLSQTFTLRRFAHTNELYSTFTARVLVAGDVASCRALVNGDEDGIGISITHIPHPPLVESDTLLLGKTRIHRKTRIVMYRSCQLDQY
jgi:hypothetical protein